MGDKRRPTIAIMTGSAESEYSKKLMAGFERCAKEEDVNLVFLMGPHIPRSCREVLSGSFAWDYEYQFHTVYDYVHFIKPDAIIIAYGSLSHFKDVPDVNEFVKRFQGIPVLMLGDAVEDTNVPYLIGGNYSGMYECVRHLVEDHGYRKIGFVAGPRRNHDSNRRMAAYKDVLAKYGLPFEDSMVVYGNYTENIDAEVEQLLDAHPDLDAICFANDNMAKAGYRVCEARDIVVGHDIAITGFDDSDLAKNLEPALSSVAHSSFLFSYRAVQAALELCRGEKPKSEEMEAFFHKRESCGCGFALKEAKSATSVPELKKQLKIRARLITDELFSTVPYKEDSSQYQEWLEIFFEEIVSSVFERDDEDVCSERMQRKLANMCRHELVSKGFLMEYIEQELYNLIDFTEVDYYQKKIMTQLRFTKQFIHSREVHVLEKKVIDDERKMWFLPSFTVDLVNSHVDMEEEMYYVMNRLKAMGIRSSYVYFYGEAVSHKQDEEFQMPETIYLNAYYNEEEMVYYTPHHRKPISVKEGDFLEKLRRDDARLYTAYVLFSGEEQYGIILCEVDRKDYAFMLSCSMQLGSLRKIMDMNLREKQMKQELEEKNKILSVMSMYDELTHLYNRRGFMEKTMALLRENVGKKAYLMIADIDHLKEINDSFGHISGDFAIKTAAEFIRYCTPTDAINARIGGDEFVSFFVSDKENHGADVAAKLRRQSAYFNLSCPQPFYVELSAGIYEFVCDENTDISEMLKNSDELLYEQKAKRRKSVKKIIGG